MRKAAIYYGERFAGELSESDEGTYIFRYDPVYVKECPGQFLTFSMPVSTASYSSRQLFPFFEGLIPEGWLLDIASNSWKINPNDRMGLLLACCQSCIGAVSVQPLPEDND